MALDFWWLEDRTATHQRVAFRVTADCTMGANGATVAITAATADGTDYVDVPVTTAAGVLSITEDAVEVDTGSYPAFAGPTEEFTMAVSGCQWPLYDYHAGHWLKDEVSLLVQSGDWFYETSSYSAWGVTGVGNCLQNPIQANWYLHHRQGHKCPGWLALGHQVPIYKIEDDHEVVNRYDRTDQDGMAEAITSYVAANGGTRADAQTAIEGFAYAAIEAYRHQDPYYACTHGAARIIVPNLMRYTDPLSKVDDVNKTKLGATQLAWLLTELSGPETFKIVISSKNLFNSWNEDGWYPASDPLINPGFCYELSTILKHIKTNAITGCVWICGDTHHPFVNKMTPKMVADKLGFGAAADYDHVITINATPSGRIADQDILGGPADGVIWKMRPDGIGTDKYGDSVVAKLIVNPEFVQFELWNLARKRIGYGIIDAGSNQMRHGWFLDT